MKTSLVLIALVLFACLAYFIGLRSRSDEPEATSISDPSRGPSFEVHVVKPRASRPLFGLLPDGIFGLPPNELQFDQSSPGAEIGGAEDNRLELRADGWELVIETDSEGKVAPGTRLLFPLELGGRQLSLRCRPADEASGHLRTSAREDSDQLGGRFLVEFAICENAATGKVIDWPPAPLTVRGSFEGLPRGGR